MPELRLTLLVVGLIFLVGLAWWELRRPHQARGSDLPRPAPEPLERTGEMSAPSRTPHSSELELPRMSARYTAQDLPIIEVAPVDADGPPMSSPATEGVEGLLAELGAHPVADPPISESDFATRAAPPAPQPQSFQEAPLVAESLPVGESLPVAESPPMAEWTQPVADPVIAPAAEPQAEAWGETADAPAAAAAAAPVVVDWPATDASRVIAVRLVTLGEKFSGRAVRLALAAEGFVIGKFSIFHKPAANGRALLSVASLTKPGTFDAQTIDLQRYGGLNLFTVLPGPLPGPDAVDELLACAQLLAQRLRGALQDEQGAPLSPARTAAMRDLAATAPAHA